MGTVVTSSMDGPNAFDSDSDSDEEVLGMCDPWVMFGAAWSRRRRKRLALYLRREWKHCSSKSAKRKFPRMDWRTLTESFLTPKEFRRFYKLDKENFKKVLKRIVPHMKKVSPHCARDQAVPYELEFACTLRWLAGGNYMDIYLMHGISESAFWRGIHAVVYALLIEYGDQELGEDKFSDPEQTEKIEKTFDVATGGLIRGCIGAIDGMACKIKRPADSECENPHSYFSRKGFYAVVLQAICDGNCLFLWGSILCGGSTHDSTCWTITDLARKFERGEVDLRYFLVGDDAYSASEQMLTPFPGSHKWKSPEDCYNFHQSSTRIRIEMAFGRLVQRFGILWRPLGCKLDFVAPVLLSCMILHNLCFDNKCSHDHMLAVSRRHVSTPFASVPDNWVGE